MRPDAPLSHAKLCYVTFMDSMSGVPAFRITLLGTKDLRNMIQTGQGEVLSGDPVVPGFSYPIEDLFR